MLCLGLGVLPAEDLIGGWETRLDLVGRNFDLHINRLCRSTAHNICLVHFPLLLFIRLFGRGLKQVFLMWNGEFVRTQVRLLDRAQPRSLLQGRSHTPRRPESPLNILFLNYQLRFCLGNRLGFVRVSRGLCKGGLSLCGTAQARFLQSILKVLPLLHRTDLVGQGRQFCPTRDFFCSGRLRRQLIWLRGQGGLVLRKDRLTLEARALSEGRALDFLAISVFLLLGLVSIAGYGLDALKIVGATFALLWLVF